MKKIFATILESLGGKSTQGEPEPPKAVDVPAESIQFSMPTISMDSIEFDMPTESSFDGAPQFHEDEWAQLEFFPGARLSEVKGLLTEFKSFEAKNRAQYGWKQIYRREISRTSIGISPTDLGHALSAKILPAPILTTSSQPIGQVRHGYSLELGTNAFLYGLQGNGQITVLGVSLQGADDMLLSDAFLKLNQRHGLILVDWRQQLVLTSINSNGQFELWRP
ncbi:hypothetical protein J2S30_004541 [Herbaspirillum rubrisubalbicans]|uniref:hypothetical protein n=1 Tax=Herbaspirillum rubrisubalbicans TaxID=80842 RepID=UPI00209FE551|nr:hypothetical protein [Herbaspirillum rubrisubalbicans]MCP1576162.1 hypothetical protein [Herbaspirillum rubrisubalbicans]